MVNSNPETVSTDFDASSRLYFEPLDAESVLEVIHAETRAGGGAAARRSSSSVARRPSTSPPRSWRRAWTCRACRSRPSTSPRSGRASRTSSSGWASRSPRAAWRPRIEEALAVADRVGYPVIVRPSFVIGGLAIEFCYGPEDLTRQLALATAVDEDRPVRIDAYLEGLEVDVDAVCDGVEVLIPGLMEHVERAGVHSGDSVAVFPPQRLSGADQGLIVDAMTRVALAIGVKGLINAQFIVRDDGVYLLEVNPRASRTVPFLSKVTGVPMVELATRVALGATLAELGWSGGLRPQPAVVAVKAPVFSTSKLKGVDPAVGPGMRSTGEVIGIHTDERVALAKALLAASLRPPVPGPDGALVLVSISDRDKPRLPELAASLAAVGYRFAATAGTAAALRASGYEVMDVTPLAGAAGSAGVAGAPLILDVIASGTVSLVVNTPSPRSGPVRDAAAIRLAAVSEGILCLTSMDTAIAAARSLDASVQAQVSDVRPLDAWLLERVPAA